MEHVLKELEHSNAENNSIAAFKQGDEGEMVSEKLMPYTSLGAKLL